MDNPKPVPRKVEPIFTDLDRGSSAALSHGYVWGESPFVDGENSLYESTRREMYKHEETSISSQAVLSTGVATTTLIGKGAGGAMALFLATGNPALGTMGALAGVTPGPAAILHGMEGAFRKSNELVEPLRIDYNELGEEYVNKHDKETDELDLNYELAETRDPESVYENFGNETQFNILGIPGNKIQDTEDVDKFLEGWSSERENVVVLEDYREDGEYKVGDILIPKEGRDLQNSEPGDWLRISYASISSNTPLGQVVYERPNQEELREYGVLEALK